MVYENDNYMGGLPKLIMDFCSNTDLYNREFYKIFKAHSSTLRYHFLQIWIESQFR